ncbi:MAG: exodeoxyribonuclease VII large subunit [Kiritimatiellia bacterium]
MAEAVRMPHVWEVSELTRHLRNLLEEQFPLIDLTGEVSGFKPYPSGHVYFTLKDSEAQISAVMFKGCFEACAAKAGIRDGARLKVRGRISVGGRSQYQILVQRARLLGEGELMQRYLELKAKLAAEGLFLPARKKALPYLPHRIGIVTSPAGAVIHDICRVLIRRYPHLEIRIYPATVQGASAPASVIAGLDYFNREWPCDVIIFGRGGGSYEDLYCFNDEALVRCVASSAVPTIASIGHETDFTLCDFAADLRAGTPSMAAELAVPVHRELADRVKTCGGRLVATLRGKYEWYAQRVDTLGDDLRGALTHAAQDSVRRAELLAGRLARIASELKGRRDLAAAQLNRLAEALAKALELRLVQLAAHVRELDAKLHLLSPYSVLERGYSLTTDASGAVVRHAAQVPPGARIHTRLQKGELVSEVC